MFEKLFESPRVLERHRRAPFAKEREQYLFHLEQLGHSVRRMRDLNALLLRIGVELDIAHDVRIRPAQISAAAEHWIQERTGSHKSTRSNQIAKTDFISLATNWLRFFDRLDEQQACLPFAQELKEFLRHLSDERGLSERTINFRCGSLKPFFLWFHARTDSLAAVTPKTITDYFCSPKTNAWKRATVVAYVQSLRAFFGYAAARGWCGPEIAESIDRPVLYSYESLPQGPQWEDVQRLIGGMSGDDPTRIRDRAAILLLAVYGFRMGEVCRLKLDDIDWRTERILLHRPKLKKRQEYPLAAEVGESIVRYIREVRPRGAYRELFLRLKTPHRPLTSAGFGAAITIHIKRLGLHLPHCGPHSLRHSCATHLLSEGFSLREISDHLGHRSARSTQIYAKVDMPNLRQVALHNLLNWCNTSTRRHWKHPNGHSAISS